MRLRELRAISSFNIMTTWTLAVVMQRPWHTDLSQEQHWSETRGKGRCFGTNTLKIPLCRKTEHTIRTFDGALLCTLGLYITPVRNTHNTSNSTGTEPQPFWIPRTIYIMRKLCRRFHSRVNRVHRQNYRWRIRAKMAKGRPFLELPAGNDLASLVDVSTS